MFITNQGWRPDLSSIPRDWQVPLGLHVCFAPAKAFTVSVWCDRVSTTTSCSGLLAEQLSKDSSAKVRFSKVRFAKLLPTQNVYPTVLPIDVPGIKCA